MNKTLNKQLKTIILLLLSILLFSLSFPGYFNKYGLPIISFIALAPMFIAIFKLNYIEAMGYGFLYGLGKYLLFNFWLNDFDPIAFAVAPGIHGIYFLVLFPIILFFYKKFPKLGYIAILSTWFSYEVFKSTNVVGYSYGLLSQTMYQTHIFTGIVDIVGSYILSLLILFPGLFLTFLISQKRDKSNLEFLIPSSIYILVMLFSIFYTQVKKVDYSNSETLRISLIQHNLNCWLSTENPQLYKQAYDNLEALSKIGESKGADLIVWPETAFVPAIEWHKKYRPKDLRERFELVKRMEEYLRSTDALYIIGNNETYNINRDITYNTAYLFKRDQIRNKYSKINLVPFTEEFPYPEKFPKLFKYVESLGLNQITPGTEQTLFDINGVKSTILICYEDAFPELARESVTNGSNLLVNITNDAWTQYSATPLQHLAAASLRTIETRRSLVRAGTSGFTGVIDPNGNIIASLPLFEKGELTYDVPIYNGHITFYTKYGNYIDYSSYFISIFFVILTIFQSYKRKLFQV